MQCRKGKNTDPTEESKSPSQRVSLKSSKLDNDRTGHLVPQTSQSEFLYGFRKVQALHDHFGGDAREDDEEGGGEDGGDDKQIWHDDFCDGEFKKVHFLQDQDIGMESKLGFLLGFKRGNAKDDRVSTLISNFLPLLLWK